MPEPREGTGTSARQPYAIEMVWPLPPAFSFVHSILKIEPGRTARGLCVVPHVDPADVPAGMPAPQLPPSLITEAIGQLAGWVAMAEADFQRRPVAALAGELGAYGGACSDTMLELEVEIDRCDADAVSYSGRAWCGGTCLVELRRSVGPMLVMEEFDDPAVVAQHFHALCEAGTTPPIPRAEVGHIAVTVLELDPGRSLRAELRVPMEAAWFAGHFPRRPVMPGTMLVDVQARLAAELASTILPGEPEAFRPVRVRGVKLRAFVPPGAVVVLEGTVRNSRRGTVDVVFEGAMEAARVSSARVELVHRDQP